MRWIILVLCAMSLGSYGILGCGSSHNTTDGNSQQGDSAGNDSGQGDSTDLPDDTGNTDQSPSDQTVPPSDLLDGQVPGDQQQIGSPPVFEALTDKTIVAGELLSFKVKVSDPDGDKLSLSASNLPTGSSFNSQTGVFSWPTGVSHIGVHANVTFSASDGHNLSSVSITITVTAAGSSDDAGNTSDTDTTTPDSQSPEVTAPPECGVASAGCGTGACTCPAGKSCFGDACIDLAPKTDCEFNNKCAQGQYCDPSVNKCLDIINQTCTYTPPEGQLEPQLLWHWDGVMVGGNKHVQVLTTPVVGYIDDDEYPDVVVGAYACKTAGWIPGSSNCPSVDLNDGVLVAIGGNTGKTIWVGWKPDGANKIIGEPRVAGMGHPTIGDLDGDGKSEVLTFLKNGGIALFDHTGKWLWSLNNDDTKGLHDGTINVVNIDQQGLPEIVVGFIVIGWTGNQTITDTPTVLWKADKQPIYNYAGTTGAVFTIAHDFTDTNATVANRKPDGYADITDGRRMYAFNDKWLSNKTLPMFLLAWENTGVGTLARGGSAAAGDIWGPSAGEVLNNWTTPYTLDGIPEVVTVAPVEKSGVSGGWQGAVYVLRANDGKILFKKEYVGRGGAPVVADMDGDGFPEIGLAARDLLLVFDPVEPNGILWSAVTKDHSSHLTSISVFDFDGKGKSEVVYNDECFLRVYNGEKTPPNDPDFKRVFFEWPNSSRTYTEYPVIVDINNDNQAEIIVGANNDQLIRDGCQALWKAKKDKDPTFVYPDTGTAGVYAFHDKFNNWVNTRKVWNQHSYHITNIFDDNKIPQKEDFTAATNNTYRQNFQGAGLFNAPNFNSSTGLSVSASQCPTSMTFSLLVENKGSIGVKAGLPVAFYLGTPQTSGTLLGLGATTKPLLPGASEVVTFTWNVPLDQQGKVVDVYAVIDDDGKPDGSVGLYNECNENDNTYELANVTCGGAVCTDHPGPPEPEKCDGIDNDCNGKIDDGLTRPCSTECGQGTEKCVLGEWVGCTAPQPDVEVCDGLDNNCDGKVDEGLPTNACGTCGETPKEVCDGVDNNCNGKIDEDTCPPGRVCDPCGGCVAICPTGECFAADAICVNGVCIPQSCLGP